MKHYVATGLAITSLLIISGCSSNVETATVKKETAQSQPKNIETANTSPQHFYKEITSGKSSTFTELAMQEICLGFLSPLIAG